MAAETSAIQYSAVQYWVLCAFWTINGSPPIWLLSELSRRWTEPPKYLRESMVSIWISTQISSLWPLKLRQYRIVLCNWVLSAFWTINVSPPNWSLSKLILRWTEPPKSLRESMVTIWISTQVSSQWPLKLRQHRIVLCNCVSCAFWTINGSPPNWYLS
jgi:hypothetical protein